MIKINVPDVYATNDSTPPVDRATTNLKLSVYFIDLAVNDLRMSFNPDTLALISGLFRIIKALLSLLMLRIRAVANIGTRTGVTLQDEVEFRATSTYQGMIDSVDKIVNIIEPFTDELSTADYQLYRDRIAVLRDQVALASSIIQSTLS